MLEGDLGAVNQGLEIVKVQLKKRNKSHRFADKNPAGWAAVEEYAESDELADDSEDQRKASVC